MLGFTIERDWVAWSVLVADALDDTVAGAGGGVDDALLGSEPADELLDTGLVEGLGQLGLLLAGGVADDGSQVNDNIVLLDECPKVKGVRVGFPVLKISASFVRLESSL